MKVIKITEYKFNSLVDKFKMLIAERDLYQKQVYRVQREINQVVEQLEKCKQPQTKEASDE